MTWVNSTSLFALLGFALGGFLGPAYGAIAEDGDGKRWSMAELLARAKEMAGSRRGRVRIKVSRSGNSNDELILIGFLVVVAVALYIHYRPWILLGLSAIAVLVFVLSSWVVIIAWLRGVIAGSGSWYLSFILPFILTAVGVVDAVLLWRGTGASPDVQAVLHSCDMDSGLPLDGATFVAYELIGALVFAFAAILSIWFSIGVVTAIYTVESARPKRLWRLLHRWSSVSDTKAVVVGLPIFGVISVIACAGLLYKGFDALGHIGQPSPQESL